jgi:type IV pilus assembly protein PilE
MLRFEKQGGFTLVELLITVAIVAILSAVAYPSYTQHIVKTKRSAAESFMVTVANRQEQSMLNARSYFQAAAGVSTEWDAVSMTVPKEVADNYTIKVVATSSPPAYTVTAAPTGSQLSRDTKCATLTYTQTGTKGKSGTAPSVSDCW